MDRFDPNEWTEQFIRANQTDCIDFLLETRNRTIELVREGKYEAAIAGFDRMLNGAVKVHNIGQYNMRTFMAKQSYCEGVIIACALNNAPDDKRRKTAIAAFADARDFAQTDGLKRDAQRCINLLYSGKSFEYIKRVITPNFPNDIAAFSLGSDEYMGIGGVGYGTAGGKSKTKTIIACIIAGSIILSVISFVAGGRLISPRVSKTQEISTFDIADETETVSEVSEPASSVAEPQDTREWAAVYREYLLKKFKEYEVALNNPYDLFEYFEFGFIHLNNDNIPELWHITSIGAHGAFYDIFTYKNGSVVKVGEAGTSFGYFERKNVFLSGGFSGRSQFSTYYKVDESGWNKMDELYYEVDENNNPILFKINGTQVTENEYKARENSYNSNYGQLKYIMSNEGFPLTEEGIQNNCK